MPRSCAEPAGIPALLSPRDKLAQLLVVGVRDAADAQAVVTNYHVGGILIGSDTDLTIFDGALAEIVAGGGPLPLAVSVDEEGGRVSRLRSLIGGTGPSARELAQTRTVQQVRDLARDRGRQMRKLGITIDFAPVVDVTDAPDDTVIGDRSFGSDPATVTAYAGAYAQGLRDAGVLPVLKHFPGHGRGSGDSHNGGVTTPPLDDLVGDDLVPYRTLVTQAPVGVMVGHLQVPGLTGSEPASLSKAAVNLLRTGTGYGAPRSMVQCSATTSLVWPRSQTGLASARRCCAPCKPVPISHCGLPPKRCPRCWTAWNRRCAPVNCRCRRSTGRWCGWRP